MRSIISSLIAVASLASASPVHLNTRRDGSCSDVSFGGLEWTVQDFDYHASYIFTTPAHQNSWGYVNFNLSNPAIPYLASCSATSNQLSDFFYGTVWYDCTLPDEAPNGGAAQFAFSRPSGKLDVNQTWTCDDPDPQYPITFHAAGTVNLTLDCTDETWQNPNWTQPGDIYSSRVVECKKVTVPVKPFEMTAVA